MATDNRGPDKLASQHLATLWEAHASVIPDEIALQHGTSRTTWRAFDDRAGRLASGLRALGVGPGDTVAIDLYNCTEYLEAFFAALKLRAVPANVNYRYLDDELRQLLLASNAVALIVHASLAERIDRLRQSVPSLRAMVIVDDRPASASAGDADRGTRYEELVADHEPLRPLERPGTDVYLSYTGGTTGLPKGVEYVIANSLASSVAIARTMLGVTDFDGDVLALRARGQLPVAVPASPLMHSTGLIMASVSTLVAGGRVITLTSRSFDPHELMAVVDAERVTTTTIVGDAFGRPLLHALDEASAAGRPYDGSSLLTIGSAGVMWSKDVKDGLFRHLPGVMLADSCGSTEGGTIGTRVSRLGDATSSDRFTPAPGIRILNESGAALPPSSRVTGLFQVPTVARGYRNDPERTARTFQTVDGARYVTPGDWGHWNDDGTVTLVGRGTTTVNTGGEKVFPEEVAKVVLGLAGVDDCVVLGVPDDHLGQRLAAVVQVRAGADVTAGDVISWVRSRLAGYKIPRLVVLADVPRAPNGKLRLDQASELLTSAAGQ